MKKKVCVITSVHQAYDGRIYHKQCKSLVKHGYEVILIAPTPENITIAREDNINLITINKPNSEWKRFLKTLTVIKLALNTKADLFHFHDPELIPAGTLIRLISRKPVIFDVHEHYPNAIMSKRYLKTWLKIPIRWVYEIIEKVCLPVMSGIVYTTKEIGARYKKYKSVKIENYPLKGMFTQTRKDCIAPKKLLYLGGITAIRGIEELIHAMEVVVKNEPETTTLTFVGAFESKAFETKIKNLISELDLENHILFKGKVPYEDIEKYLSTSSIGIIPYLPVPNHLVCLPNKLFEYMASGVAVVASDFDHYGEVVNQSNSGITVDPSNPLSIAHGLLSLMRDPEKVRSFSSNGQYWFNEKYNWEIEEKKLINFYQNFI
ncbi:glycosyltransferase involved in cell wall biosynthesis [Bacillus pakistanensis]|uniref:Glycosyltransferase involved in cell wall biosynthesis n=1 Tax=Rossellomorea pakistanensis TaxID=992288 RepID=A0ABS2ND35_9BACI|nr:glycosyltransferase family 4 protein [Bacillus pakistanensis]MBM7585770.1 glycosyltransferase involved in cell wall biosynthesis [Bacillus pakistanensis]